MPSQPRVSSDLSAWTLYTCPLERLESAIRLRRPMAFSGILLTPYSRSDTTSVSHDSLEHPGVLPTLLFCRPLIGQQHVDDIALKNTVCVSRNVCKKTSLSFSPRVTDADNGTQRPGGG